MQEANNSVEKQKKAKIKRNRQTLWKLFTSTLYISTFTFGGGFVIVTFMKRKFVDEFHWIDEEEMLDLTALAQSSPGAIAVNASILVGWHVAGLPGMLIAVLGTILPPMLILTVISFFYKAFISNRYVSLLLKGMQAGVAAVILDVVLSLEANIRKTRRPFLYLILAAAFIATFFFQINVIFIILTAICIGTCLAIIQKKKGGSPL